MRTRSTAVRARQLLEDGQSAIEAGDHAGSIPILEQAAQLGRLLLAAGLAHPEARDPDLAAVTAHAVAAVHTLTPDSGEVTGRAG